MAFKFPLLEDSFSDKDINQAVKVLKSKKITMSKITRNFERKFSQFIGKKYCLMVNSGSSANLLSFFALTNPLKKKKLNKGDECIVPAICWSTSLWPIYQAGLVPIFIDVDLKTFSPSFEMIKSKITKKTRAIMLINVLGNCTEIDKIKSFAKKKKIYLIEDNCESLGSLYKNKMLGTYGDFSTFSFYYSHQLTAGEGGMVACDNYNDYKILLSLRAHGWDREITKKKNTFNFINQGFNLRPLDISAAIAMNQLKRLNNMIKARKLNRDKIVKALKNSPKWKNQFSFFEASEKLKPSWFCLPFLVNKKFLNKKKTFLKHLEKNKVETRPIISGNFINQPCIKLYKFKFNRSEFISSQKIEERGFFIGLPIKILKKNAISKLVNLLLDLN